MSHELDVFRGEGLISPGIQVLRSRLPVFGTVGVAGSGCAFSLLTSRSRLLFLSNAAHLDFGTGIFVSRRLVFLFFSPTHHGLCLLHNLALSVILELSTVHHWLIVLLHGGRWLVCRIVTITDELLSAGLLSETRLLVLHGLHASPFFILLTLAFSFFFSDALTLFLLTTLLSFLLLATTLLLLLLTSFLFGRRSLLGLLLSLHLGAHSSLIVASISRLALIFSRSTASHDLRDVRCRVNTGCGSSEHHLQEVVSLIWFLTGDNLARFDIDLLADNKFGQADHLYQKVDFRLLFRDRL